MTISKERKAELIKTYGKNEHDSGSAAVQVAILTDRIKELTEHMKSHKKDFHTRRGLLMLVGKRRRLLSYIKGNDINEYRELIAKLGIRDNIQEVDLRGALWRPFSYRVPKGLGTAGLPGIPGPDQAGGGASRAWGPQTARLRRGRRR